MTPTFYSRFGKRWFDAIAAFLGLLLLSPILLVVAVAVRLSSPGPALFLQLRTGRFDRRFRIFKFRTMKVVPNGSGSLITAIGDARVTPLGRWLRKTKIDELPQLFNVLAGQMSLVGPRPEVPLYTATYSGWQKRVLLVRPGITSPDIDFDEEEALASCQDKESFYLTTVLPTKLEGELAYCNQISFLGDQRIVFRTVFNVLRRLLKTRKPFPGLPSPSPSAEGQAQAGSLLARQERNGAASSPANSSRF